MSENIDDDHQTTVHISLPIYNVKEQKTCLTGKPV
jgi:hypothetical protein